MMIASDKTLVSNISSLRTFISALRHVQGSPIRLVLGSVISPLRQHAESRNLGQTLFGSPVFVSNFGSFGGFPLHGTILATQSLSSSLNVCAREARREVYVFLSLFVLRA